MDKTGKENLVCTYCQRPALSDTYPPVCEEHLMLVKEAAEEEARTLKELEVKHD